MNKDIFDREIAMCRELSKKNEGACNWGNCDNCGVIPLLYKLHKEVLYENRDDIADLKRKILN